MQDKSKKKREEILVYYKKDSLNFFEGKQKKIQILDQTAKNLVITFFPNKGKLSCGHKTTLKHFTKLLLT